MKRWLWVLALVAVGLIVRTMSAQVGGGAAKGPQGDLGPGAGGSTLRLPGLDPGPAPANPAVPAFAQPSYPGALPAASMRPGTTPRVATPPSNRVDLNKDITITPEVGPWTILVMSYTTPRDNPDLDAALMAREFVTEWNRNPAYAKFKLKAHVFNYGAEEKQKEYERVQKLKQDHIDALNKMGFEGKSMPLRVSTIHIDEHTAVLLGGFKDAEAATSVAKELRKIKVTEDFAKRVKVDRRLAAVYEADTATHDGSVKQQIDQYVNPFTKALPVRNPSVKEKLQAGMTPEQELEYLRKINQGEKPEWNLLNTRRPWTLAVKQFNSQTKTMTDAKEAKDFIKAFDSLLGRKTGEWTDLSAHNAHNLAEGLRKTGLEAYVLHCQCCSYVTVGSYSRVDDPQLVQMQRVLETHFQAPGFQPLEMFPRPVPMPVPGVAK